MATLLLDEIKSEQRWTDSFSKSQEMLKSLADEALAEVRAGKVNPLDESL